MGAYNVLNVIIAPAAAYMASSLRRTLRQVSISRPTPHIFNNKYR